jgi:hypothetical protein
MLWRELTEACTPWFEKPNTRDAYQKEWRRFHEWFLVEYDESPDPAAVDRGDIEAFLDAQSISVGARALSALRRLFR